MFRTYHHPEGRIANISIDSNSPVLWYEYTLRDHLGNSRVSFSDISLPAGIEYDDRLQTNTYYPYGSTIAPLSSSNQFVPNDYKYNNKEYIDDLNLNMLDYGARLLDPLTGRWNGVDALAEKFHSSGGYNYVLGNPINNIDPDGMRTYFVGGANNDQDGWDYINRFKKIFTINGISGFTRIDASGGKIGDVAFTASYRNFSYVGQELVKTDCGFELQLKRRYHVQIEKSLNDIMTDLAIHPLKNGEQLNLAGYSYGSVLQAQVALRLADKGIKVDNLILIGSPISDKSELYHALVTNANISKVIRHDIPNDMLSNPQSESQFTMGGWQNSSDSGPHFDLARPGKEADEKIKKLSIKLKKEGVK